MCPADIVERMLWREENELAQCVVYMIWKMNTVLFSIVLFNQKVVLFVQSSEKKVIHFLTVDDAQKLSWLFTHTFKLACYLEKV